MQEELNQLESRLSAIFNNSFHSILLIDLSHMIMEFNQSAEAWAMNVYGRKIEQGNSILDFVSRDDMDEFVAGLDEISGKNSGRTKFFSIVPGADTRDYWFEYQLYPVISENVVKSIYIKIIDITERKFAIDQIARNSKRFYSLVNNSSDIVAILDAEGVIQYINDSAMQILGYRPRDFETKNIFDFLFPDDIKGFTNFYENALKKTGLSFIAQFRVRHADNYWIFFEATGNNLLTDESVHGMVLNLRDITDSKLVEEMLQKISRQNELILESAGEGIYGINTKGNITFVNPAAALMLGYQVSEMIGRDQESVFRHMRSDSLLSDENVPPSLIAMKEGTVRTARHVLFIRRDESAFPVEYIATPIRERGEIVGAVVIFTDVSERKRAEKELRKAKQEADAASLAKSDFLANMSHEIRTPLNSLLGFLELLSGTQLDETQLEYLTISRESARTLLEIISDILDYTKIERGRLELEDGEFNPRHEFETALELFTARAQEKLIHFSAFIDPGLPELARGDPLRIKQILNNLIGNAIKFTARDGSVHIEILKISESVERCSIHFSVKDDGIGIPEDKQRIIFESFTQAENSTTRKYGGTGLGLAISRDLVNLMGGKLQLESAQGEGSRFHFEISLPISGDRRSHTRKKDIEHFSLAVYAPAGESHFQEKIIRRYLHSLHHTTEFLDSLKGNRDFSGFDALIAVIPDNSIKLLQRLRRRFQFAGLIMIIEERQRTLVRGLKAGGVYIIVKPVTATKLIGVLYEMSAQKMKTKKPAAEPEEGRMFSGKALVAEDSPANRMLARRMLEKLGLRVKTAGNGKEAVKMCAGEKFDIVFMDINMPECNGIEAARILTAGEKKLLSRHTPIIALTAKVMKGDRESFLSAGMDDYLAKPFDINSLWRMLQRYMPGKKSKRQAQPGTKNTGRDILNIKNLESVLGLERNDVIGIIEEFVIDARKQIKALEKASAKGNLPAINAVSHKLKGASANLQFARMAALNKRVEEASQRGKKIRYEHYIERIGKELLRIEAAFKKLPGRKR